MDKIIRKYTLTHIGFCLILAFAYLTNAKASDQKVSLSTYDFVQQSVNAGLPSNVIVELDTNFQAAFDGLQMDSFRKNAVQNSALNFRLMMSEETKNRIQHEYEYISAAILDATPETLQELENNPFVKAVYPNKRRSLSLDASVPLVFGNHETSEFDGNNEWAVAVLDTGTESNHSFLASDGVKKVVSEACYSGGNFSNSFIQPLCPSFAREATGVGSAEPCSDVSGCYHGTHVAGIAAGDRDGSSEDGVAHGGKIISMQVFTRLNSFFYCGGSNSCISVYDSDLIKAMERVYALRNSHKIAAVNLSLGGGEFTSSCDGENTVMTNIVSLLKSAGIATVAAVGNEGKRGRISYPACISDVIAVGATNTSDDQVAFSNDAPTLDLFAPGYKIFSSVPGNIFLEVSGTSMSTPHVAGAFAVLRQAAKDDVSVDQLVSVLKSVGPSIPMRGGQGSRKRLDVSAALIELYNRGLGVSSSITIVPILQLLLLSDD